METKLKQLQTFFVIYNKKISKYLGHSFTISWVDDYLDLQQDFFGPQKVRKIKTIDDAKEILNILKPKKDYCIKKVSIRTTIDTEEEIVKCH